MQPLPSRENVDPQHVARDIATHFAKLDMVESITLAGSLSTGRADAGSDIDLNIYYHQPLPLEVRLHIIKPRSSHLELDAAYWGTEDYWLEKESDLLVEAAYESKWPEDYLKDLLTNNRAQMGFTTSVWHSLAKSTILFDRNGWFAAVQQMADVPYPDALAEAIIRKNFALLRGSLIAHPKQLALAAKRKDVIHVHHRLDMMLACYFDIVFALNRKLHPGDKRMLEVVADFEHKPEGMPEDVTDLLEEKDFTKLEDKVKQLLDRLEILLRKQDAI